MTYLILDVLPFTTPLVKHHKMGAKYLKSSLEKLLPSFTLQTRQPVNEPSSIKYNLFPLDKNVVAIYIFYSLYNGQFITL